MKNFKDTPVADFALKTPKLLVFMYLCMKVNIPFTLPSKQKCSALKQTLQLFDV